MPLRRGIKLVLASAEDPDLVGCFKQWRVAFYVAGEQDALENAFMLLDSFFTHRAKMMARATNFEVQIYPYEDVDLSALRENMTYTPLTFHPPSREGLPLKIFEARVLVVTVVG